MMYISHSPAEAAQHFRDNGFAIIPVLTPAQCKALVLEQWDRVLTQQGVQEAYQLQTIPSIAQIVKDRDCLYHDDILASPNLSLLTSGIAGKSLLDVMTNRWVRHRDFGACSDPQVFNLPLVWQDVRSSPKAADAAANILGTHRIHCDVNRCIQRLPGQGMAELLHWDLNPFDQDWDAAPEAIGGKVVFTNADFICVPGSHKREWIDAHFAPHFQHLRPKAKGKAKFDIPTNCPEGLAIRDMAQTVRVPQGHYIMWDARLVHGTKRLATRNTQIEFGAYFGFFTEAHMNDPDSVAAYEKAATEARRQLAAQWKPETIVDLCGNTFYLGDQEKYDEIMARPVDEINDRLYSFAYCVAPLLWPSLDAIHYTPNMWTNFHAAMVERIRRLDRRTCSQLVTAKLVVNEHWTLQMGTTDKPLEVAFLEAPFGDFMNPPYDTSAMRIGIEPKAEGRKRYARWHVRIATPHPSFGYKPSAPVHLQDLAPHARRLLGAVDYDYRGDQEPARAEDDEAWRDDEIIR